MLTEPVRQDESALLGEVAVVKDEQELGAILAQTLQTMRHTAGEVPQVALLQVINEVAALIVQRRNAHLAVENIGPLGLLVPVQLADDALAQTHVDAGEFARGGQLADGGLAGPASFLVIGRMCCQLCVFCKHIPRASNEASLSTQQTDETDIPQFSHANLQNSSAYSPCCRGRC